MKNKTHAFTDSIQDLPGFPDTVTVEFIATLIWSEPYVGPYKQNGGYIVNGITWNRKQFTEEQNISLKEHIETLWNEYEQQVCEAVGIEY
jgi:hypothetical protein